MHYQELGLRAGSRALCYKSSVGNSKELNSVPFNMEFIDPESHQVREVYAHFGLAMYYAQGLERTLALALSTVYGSNSLSRSQFEALRECNYKKTLGQLIQQIRQTVAVDKDLEAALFEALRKRNWLAHGYFWDRAAAFCKEDGRRTMINELKGIADYLQQVDGRFDLVVRQWGHERGLTDEMIHEEMRKLLNES